MSSTEFTVGLEGGRSSSKVLKPPGGGSSDIFNVKPSPAKEVSDRTTKSRVFGIDDVKVANSPIQLISNQENPVLSKKYVRKNPITGEGYDFTEEPDKPLFDNAVSEKAPEQPKTETPKAIQTSIRVRNPPGGKSSGIF